jgi:hypothetical protein
MVFTFSNDVVAAVKEQILSVLEEYRPLPLRRKILAEEWDRKFPEKISLLEKIHRKVTVGTYGQVRREATRRQAEKELIKEGKIIEKDGTLQLVN